MAKDYARAPYRDCEPEHKTPDWPDRRIFAAMPHVRRPLKRPRPRLIGAFSRHGAQILCVSICNIG